MMAITHAVISTSLTTLILGKVDTLTIGLSILGSQLPDLDSSKSIIGQIFFPISGYIENNFPHRSITHSLLATGFISAIALSLGYYFFNDIWYLIALPIGHLISCFSDTFTKQGVQLFYPNPAWAISVSNPHKRLRTGSTSEYYVLVVFSILLFTSFSIINTSSGLNNAVGLKLGLRSEIINIYNQDAGEYSFNADIKGYFTNDRTPINKTFQVITAVGEEFLVTDKINVYKTGENIIVEKIELNKGNPRTIKIENLKLDDENVSKKLSGYPNDIYLVGTLKIDYPEDIQLPVFVNEYEYIKISNETITLDYCPIVSAQEILDNQFGIGEITLIKK